MRRLVLVRYRQLEIIATDIEHIRGRLVVAQRVHAKDLVGGGGRATARPAPSARRSCPPRPSTRHLRAAPSQPGRGHRSPRTRRLPRARRAFARQLDPQMGASSLSTSTRMTPYRMPRGVLAGNGPGTLPAHDAARRWAHSAAAASRSGAELAKHDHPASDAKTGFAAVHPAGSTTNLGDDHGHAVGPHTGPEGRPLLRTCQIRVLAPSPGCAALTSCGARSACRRVVRPRPRARYRVAGVLEARRRHVPRARCR